MLYHTKSPYFAAYLASSHNAQQQGKNPTTKEKATDVNPSFGD